MIVPVFVIEARADFIVPVPEMVPEFEMLPALMMVPKLEIEIPELIVSV